MRLMYVEPIQAINVKHVVAKAEACTPPTFDHRTVAIHVNIVLGWRLLRERRLSAQGTRSTGGRVRDRRSNLHRLCVRFGFVPTHAMEHPNTKSTSGS